MCEVAPSHECRRRKEIITLTIHVPVVVHVVGTSALGRRFSAVSVWRSTGKHQPAGCPVTGTNDCKGSGTRSVVPRGGWEGTPYVIVNDTVVPVDAQVQRLTLRTRCLGNLRTGRRRVRAGAVAGGPRVMMRA